MKYTNELKKLGFNMTDKNFGTIKPEFYDVGKNHFKPTFRSVYELIVVIGVVIVMKLNLGTFLLVVKHLQKQ